MPVPPKDVRNAAKNALERRQKYNRGGTAVGVARARDLANGRNISEQTLGRMISFFARHGGSEDSMKARRDKTSAASIAWGLWGGSPGRAWAIREMARIRDKKK